MIDYDFCLNSKLTLNDLLIWLDLDQHFLDYYSDDFFERYAMFIDDRTIRISVHKNKFDRWANSEDLRFDVSRRREKREFIDWVKEQRCKQESD